MTLPYIGLHAIMHAATRIIEASGHVIDPAESSTVRNRMISYILWHEPPDKAFLVEYASSSRLSSAEAQELFAAAMPAMPARTPVEFPLWTEAEDQALATQNSSNDADGVHLRQSAALGVLSAVGVPMLRHPGSLVQSELAKPENAGCRNTSQMLTTGPLLSQVEPVKATSVAPCVTACRSADVEPTGSTWEEEASKNEVFAPSELETSEVEPDAELKIESQTGLVELEGECEAEAEGEVGRSPGCLDEVTQVDADATYLRPAEKNAPPSRADLMYAEFQVWNNASPELSRQSEWTLKIRSEGYTAKGVRLHYIGFQSSPRRARAAVRRFAKDGRISTGWADQFCAETADLHTATHVGVASTRRYIATKRPQGESSNARAVYEGCWATLILNAEQATPGSLLVYFPGSTEPVVIEKFITPNAKKENRPNWLAYYDPDQLYALKREQEVIDRHLAERKMFASYSPTTKLAKYLATYWNPLIDAYNQMSDEYEMLKQRVEALETMVRGLAGKAPE